MSILQSKKTYPITILFSKEEVSPDRDQFRKYCGEFLPKDSKLSLSFDLNSVRFFWEATTFSDLLYFVNHFYVYNWDPILNNIRIGVLPTKEEESRYYIVNKTDPKRLLITCNDFIFRHCGLFTLFNNLLWQNNLKDITSFFRELQLEQSDWLPELLSIFYQRVLLEYNDITNGIYNPFYDSESEDPAIFDYLTDLYECYRGS